MTPGFLLKLVTEKESIHFLELDVVLPEEDILYILSVECSIILFYQQIPLSL